MKQTSNRISDTEMGIEAEKGQGKAGGGTSVLAFLQLIKSTCCFEVDRARGYWRPTGY